MQEKQCAGVNNNSRPTATRSRTAAYIAALAEEMARLAQREKLAPLGRALRFARDEARRAALSE